MNQVHHGLSTTAQSDLPELLFAEWTVQGASRAAFRPLHKPRWYLFSAIVTCWCTSLTGNLLVVSKPCNLICKYCALLAISHRALSSVRCVCEQSMILCGGQMKRNAWRACLSTIARTSYELSGQSRVSSFLVAITSNCRIVIRLFVVPFRSRHNNP